MVIYFCGCVTVKKTGFKLQAQVVQEKRHKLSSDSLNLNGLPEKFLYPAIGLFREPCSSFTFRRVDSRCNPVSYSLRLLGAAARCVASALSGDLVRIKSSCVLHLCVITESASRTLRSVFHFEEEFTVAATAKSVFVADIPLQMKLIFSVFI